MKKENVTILFNKSFTLKTLEISHIEYSHEYNFVESLFSSLFEYDNNGNIIGGLAKSRKWIGSDLHIELRNDITTTLGQPITSNDIRNSLIRTIKSGATTHGYLTTYLKSKISPEEAIVAQEKNIIILKLEVENDEVIKLLANPEWAIVPTQSLHHKEWSLDYSNTSGAYHIASETPDGYILKANKNHYRHSDKTPFQITLKYLGYDPKVIFKAIEDGEVDVIPTYYGVDSILTLEHFANKNGYNFHVTQNLLLDFIQFTKRGLAEIPLQRRIAIGKKIRENFAQQRSVKEAKETLSFFSTMGDSILSNEDEKRIEDLYRSVDHSKETGQGIIIQTNFKELEDKQREKYGKALPDISVKAVQLSDLLYNKNYVVNKDTPHLIIFNIDSGFSDDLSLISYSVSTGIFDIIGNSQQWYEKYLKLNKTARREELNKVHNQILTSAAIIPIQSLPYVAVFRSPWKMNYTTLSAGTPFWAIEHE